MSALIISGIAISSFLFALLISKKQRLQADLFLIVYLTFFIVNQLYLYVESTGVLNESPWMILGKGFYLLDAPMFFYYVYALIKDKRMKAWIYILTLVPAAVYVITFFYYYQLGFDHHIQVETGLLYVDHQLSPIWTFFVILFHVSGPFYLVWFFVIMRDYKKRMADSLSNTDRVNLNWLQILFYIWIFSFLILFPFSVLSVGLRWIPLTLPQTLLQIANVAFIFIAGYYGFRQTNVFTDVVEKQEGQKQGEGKSYQRSGLSKEQAQDYHAKLLQLMKEKKPFLNGELNAQQLANELNISVNHLSQVLNQEQQQNFFDFVNSYRVREVQEKMADTRFGSFTLLAIALESGFNSKTSFNTIFKKFTHQTPSQYYQSLKG